MTIATIDEGRLIDVNERAIELSGYSREEMIGRTSIEIGLWAYPRERDRLIASPPRNGVAEGRHGPLQNQGGGREAGAVVRRCHSAGRKKGDPHDHPRHLAADRGTGKTQAERGKVPTARGKRHGCHLDGRPESRDHLRKSLLGARLRLEPLRVDVTQDARLSAAGLVRAGAHAAQAGAETLPRGQ